MKPVRIAMYGWDHNHAAVTAEDVNAAFGVVWVEVEGCRITQALGATITGRNAVIKNGAGEEVQIVADSFSEVQVTLCGPVEIVYVDKDGEPLPGAAPQPLALPERLAHDVVVKVGPE